MTARRPKQITELVVSEVVEKLQRDYECNLKALAARLGTIGVTLSTLRRYIEARLGMQVMPVRERWFYRSQDQQLKKFGHAYDPNDPMDAKHFVASGSAAEGYCTMGHATEAMRQYFAQSKTGKAKGAVNSRERTRTAYALEGVGPEMLQIYVPPGV